MNSTEPVLDIVIVTSAGGRDLLRACLDSLEQHPLRSSRMRVMVLDNASEDGTVEMVRGEFREVELMEMGWNAGFCIANNKGLRRGNAPLVLLLNPDTEAREGALDHMVKLMQDNPEVGMAGCRLELRDGSLDHAAKRSFPTPLSAVTHFTGIGRRPAASDRLAQYRAPGVDEHGTGEVDAVNGAFMLCRREAVEDVGPLDEAYWLYMEDLDWCYRFKQVGWKVLYDGRVTFLHVKGGTTVSERGARRYRGSRHNVAFHRSIGRFYRKFYAGTNPLLDIAIYLAIGAKLAVSLVRSTVARRSLA